MLNGHKSSLNLSIQGNKIVNKEGTRTLINNLVSKENTLFQAVLLRT